MPKSDRPACSFDGSNSTMTMHPYVTLYDCNNEIDTSHLDILPRGYTGKSDTHECTFKINKTDVYV
ncbi:hypothetical protein HEB29_003736 [Streptomyces fulvorobeus]|uniref:Uncharacterized protein n=2 Tax=Streptomyces fulvorobeus TaxID=284028 RepID=A0A7Y9HDY0_9ACTN|nr:hypothetical protein [Streptomyces fulvorobeus]